MKNVKTFGTRSIKSFLAVAPKLSAKSPDSITVIGYHRVVSDIKQAEENSIFGLVVSAETFREHCRILKENYDVISLEDTSWFLQNNSNPSRPKAVITFDDGYLDNYEVAYPILREFDLPATIFLPTSLIGTDEILAHDKAFWLSKVALERKLPLEKILAETKLEKTVINSLTKAKDALTLSDAIVYLPSPERDRIIDGLEKALEITQYPAEYQLMNWEMAREMEQNRISFGVHSATHPVLPLESDHTFETEIFESKQVLERELKTEAVSFAYPNGKYNARVLAQIVNAGYKIGVTTEKRVNKSGDDLLVLGRICLCEESTRGIFGKFSPAVARFRLGVRPSFKFWFIFHGQPAEQL
jgi:peptidoglycan/xylan/chitin deacetylase (PgdA/CDA1 family)